MEMDSAVAALSALAQETRLALFRALVAAGPEGVAAGDLARSLDVAASTLSHHLTTLDQAGLITHTRRQRHIIYTVNVDNVRRLLAFLIEDCCGGRPDLCGIAAATSCTPSEALHA